MITGTVASVSGDWIRYPAGHLSLTSGLHQHPVRYELHSVFWRFLVKMPKPIWVLSNKKTQKRESLVSAAPVRCFVGARESYPLRVLLTNDLEGQNPGNTSPIQGPTHFAPVHWTGGKESTLDAI
jgi:hypothetical protein